MKKIVKMKNAILLMILHGYRILIFAIPLMYIFGAYSEYDSFLFMIAYFLYVLPYMSHLGIFGDVIKKNVHNIENKLLGY